MTAHWGVGGPGEGDRHRGREAAHVRRHDADAHAQRINIFTNLPIDKLSKLSLQKHLGDIGKTKADTEPA
jgi:hypothetical protein